MEIRSEHTVDFFRYTKFSEYLRYHWRRAAGHREHCASAAIRDSRLDQNTSRIVDLLLECSNTARIWFKAKNSNIGKLLKKAGSISPNIRPDFKNERIFFLK